MTKGKNFGKVFFACYFPAILILSPFFVVPALAHGGEDHGESKIATVSNSQGVVTQTTKVGDLEVLLKYASLEPDTPMSGRLFVTRFATNEPISDAAPTIEIIAHDGKTYQGEMAKSAAPGNFSFKLPPLTEGTYTILTRLSAAGKTETATFSGIKVEHSASETATESATSWLRTALIILGGIVFLGLFGGLMFFAWRFATREQTTKEAISA